MMIVRKVTLTFILFLLFSVFSCRHSERQANKAVSADSLAAHATDLAARDSLIRSLAVFSNDPVFRNASVGYIILDCTRGLRKVIAEMNAADLLIPASIQKLLTTGAALEILGSGVYHEVIATNQLSINWRANRLMQKIGKEKYGMYDFTHGSRAVLEFWKEKGLDTGGISMIDGSGRSRDNKLSARQVADLLYKMTFTGVFPVFYNSLPLAGISGTMHKWLIGTSGEGRVRAKTGSLAGVRSYAGYVKTVTGKQLIFTIIVNDFSCSVPRFKKKMEQVMVRMSEI